MHLEWTFLVHLLLGLSIGVLGKKDKPEIEETEFEHFPTNLFYFDDSDVVLLTEANVGTTYRSEDAGVKWSKLKDVDEGQTLDVLQHPYDNQVAVLIGTGKKHWTTYDQGKSWMPFKCPDAPTRLKPSIEFHATDSKRLLFHAVDCGDNKCQEKVYYTTDGFDTGPKVLHENAMSCQWAKSTDVFTTGDEDMDRDQILCLVQGITNPSKLITSSDYFKSENEPTMNKGRAVSGVVKLAPIQSYIVAVAQSKGTKELAMYVTDDASEWHRAEFGEHKLEEDAYTLVESSNYSMRVDVLTTRDEIAMGTLLTSNSNGTFFSKNIEHTNRNKEGYVDFEKIQNIQGILLVNTVDNWKEVERSLFGENKKVKSKISFDDGRTWQSMKTGNDKNLHVHSMTQQRNVGRVFSSPAPGIVMGVGNTGKALRPYSEGDLFVSDNAGLTWRKARNNPHLYEFGDQGSILVAVEDGETDKVWWSLNHGKDWDSIELEGAIQPLTLTTVPDSTSLKFLMIAVKGRGHKLKNMVYSLDFSGLHERECEKKDFEEWYARVDGDGEPTCIMGHTQKFRRRKPNAECFINEEFKDPVPKSEDCKCVDEDYECDYENGFSLKDGECVLTGTVRQPGDECQKEDDTFMGSSGYTLIPGNTCVKKGGVVKDKPKERECKDTKKPATSGEISSAVTRIPGEGFVEYMYLERTGSNHGDDETVIMRTNRREAWLTHDHGKKWEQIVKDEEVIGIYPHEYINDNVYLVTPSKKVFYSKDFGRDIHSFQAPDAPKQDRRALSFHPVQKDWLIWLGGKDCKKGDCQTVAHVSRKGGDDWETLLRSVRKCEFVYREGLTDSDQLVYCEQHQGEDSGTSFSLMSSDDWFEHKDEKKQNVISFATMAEYIVIAFKDDEKQSLQVDTSIDGKTLADAKFPHNFEVPHQQAYTVLDSSTHAIFMHVTINGQEEQEYGSIVKSNSNGTSYVLSVSEVNRNTMGYVDFEKMQGLEGVAVINRVVNTDDVSMGAAKKLRTYITHNDGADWSPLPIAENWPDGKGPDCKAGQEGCGLHLHGYTERRDSRDTYSSPSAVGLMFATGNVGSHLGFKKDADTYVTRDGGVTWRAVFPGNWMWEFGDQGSVVVIVKEDEPTNQILYSLNEGIDWFPYQFAKNEMLVQDITTVPSDTSLNFMLWGKLGSDIATVNIDFTGLPERERQCVLDEENPASKKSDYDLWSPAHPNSGDKCLFGHVAEYHRKIPDHNCFNGDELKVQHLHAISQNCTCTRQDFECDYNFERQPDGSCILVPGLEPADPREICRKDKNAYEYYETTGYRRIPLTTCEGGVEFDLTSAVHPCPNKEPEFRKHHGISGVGLFFAIVIPFAAAAGVGYYVWRNWGESFGRIQLGGSSDGPIGSSIGYGAFDRDAPWVRYPVMAVSGIVAVLAALPMLAGRLWGAASTRLGRGARGGYSRPFTSRSSFQRGRGDYASVGADEGELLGDESDEDV